MTIDVQPDLFVHTTTANRVSTFNTQSDGGLRVRVKNPTSVNVDDFSYADRLKLMRFLAQGMVFGPNYRMQDFADGLGGPNGPRDRYAYVDSFGPWKESPEALDLNTWINHDDSSRLDGDWDERIKTYYAARGY